jgi:hypothetical protein
LKAWDSLPTPRKSTAIHERFVYLALFPIKQKALHPNAILRKQGFAIRS